MRKKVVVGFGAAAREVAVGIWASLVEMDKSFAGTPSHSGVGWIDLHHDVLYDRSRLGYAIAFLGTINLKCPVATIRIVKKLDQDLKRFLPRAYGEVRKAPDFRPFEPERYPKSFWWYRLR